MATAKAITKKPKAAKEPKAKEGAVVKNGITAPGKDTAAGKIFLIADKLNKGKDAVKRSAVLEAAEAEGINPATASTQYARWRTFNGITGRAAA